jgi:hypothetical protein
MRRVLLFAATLLVLSTASLSLAAEPKKTEPAPTKTHRPSDVVFILIETSEYDDQAGDELQRMYDLLRKLDKDKTGHIDAEALKTARHQIIEDRADALMAKLDADKDGKISRDEACGRILEHFERIDANHDGFIERDELVRAIAQRKNPSK